MKFSELKACFAAALAEVCAAFEREDNLQKLNAVKAEGSVLCSPSWNGWSLRTIAVLWV